MKADSGHRDAAQTASPSPERDETPHKVSPADLFTGFLQIGLYGFGGLAAISRHIIVDQRKWLNNQDYAALFGICQALPGGNVINVATILGDRFGGLAGSVAAVSGLFAMPLVLLLLLAAGYDQISGLPDVKAAMAGAAPAAAGLVVGTAIKMMRALKLSYMATGFSLVAFICVAMFRFPLVPTLAFLLPLCVAATFRERRR